ncbi:methyltransferase domain-containing protein, partial [Candidatus Latescibacterota bacterium]
VIAVNLGSGSSNISDKVSNVDVFAYNNVDLTCSAEKLPFRNESVDVIVNIAVLEHLPHPESVIDEFYRILKKDGVIYLHFPFIQGFHASPDDFSRRTYEGIKVLLKDFEELDIHISGGPTSGFLWIFQEWIAIVLSFGIKPLYLVIFLASMLVTFPLKFLDIILRHHPMAKNIASGFVFTGKKR